MATVHLVCGFLGAGKTTFSVALARQRDAVRFSVDELYLRIFVGGPTYELDQQALDRLLDALDDLWPQVVQAGVDVVLDFGFWRRKFRDDVRRRAQSTGASVQLYWLRCPDDVALARCLKRNGSNGAFLISKQGFRELKPRFESPFADEPCQIIDTEHDDPSTAEALLQSRAPL
jgi:predicted kinase